MALSISNNAAKAACDAIVDLIDVGGGGKLRIYSGTVPTDADTALGAQVLLAELNMNATAFGSAADLNPGARATANAITDDTAANATGTASFFRVVNAAGTCIMQGSVSATGGGGDLQLNTVSIVINAAVQVTAFTFTVPES